MSAETLLLGVVAGLALGWVYFRGLWWTAERALHARRPGALLFASYLARTALTLAVFVALLRLGAGALVAALVGFVAARTLVVRHRAEHGRTAGGSARAPTSERREAKDDPLT